MRRIVFAGVAGLALSLGAVSAQAGWLEETNGSGSMYLPPRVRPGAAVNYAGSADAAMTERGSNGAYQVGVFPQPVGPPVLAAPPSDW
jgi:hypothetical protein